MSNNIVCDNFIRKCELRKVIDGDTLDVYVNFGLGFFCNARIRLQDISAPEIFKVKKESEEFIKGKIAKLIVSKWLYGYEKKLFVRAEHRGLYGRWLGEIWKEGHEESLNSYLKKQQYKSSYKPWYHQEPLSK